MVCVLLCFVVYEEGVRFSLCACSLLLFSLLQAFVVCYRVEYDTLKAHRSSYITCSRNIVDYNCWDLNARAPGSSDDNVRKLLLRLFGLEPLQIHVFAFVVGVSVCVVELNNGACTAVSASVVCRGVSVPTLSGLTCVVGVVRLCVFVLILWTHCVPMLVLRVLLCLCLHTLLFP